MRSVWARGRSKRPDGCLKLALQHYAPLRIPEAVGSNRFGFFPSQLALRLEKEGDPPPGSDEEREEPMSSTSTSDDEFPIQDDEAVSELVRTPIRAAADLEDELEPVADFEERGPTNREMLEDLLRRVERIEKHLGIHES